MSHSVDMRERVIQFIKERGTKTEAAQLFKLSRQTLYNWTRKLESRGTLEDPPPRRPWKKIDPHKLKAFIKENPDSTQSELAHHFSVHKTAITYALSRLKITRKKTTLYRERNEGALVRFLGQVKSYSPENIVYIDESRVDGFLHKPYAWAPKGQKVIGEISGKLYPRESFVAGLCANVVLAPLCYQGTCNTALFNMWIQDFLVPNLKPGQVVVMDNATFHKKPTHAGGNL